MKTVKRWKAIIFLKHSNSVVKELFEEDPVFIIRKVADYIEFEIREEVIGVSLTSSLSEVLEAGEKG